MIDRITTSSAAILIAAVAGWVAHGSSSPVHAAWTGLARARSTPDRLLEHAVVLLCAATSAVLVLWLLTSLVVCSLDAVCRGADPSRSGLFRPRLVRALVSATVGAVVATSGPGPAGAEGYAAADRDPTPSSPPLPASLDGLPLPDRSYGGVHFWTVRPGDSLWSISADLLQATGTARAGHRPADREVDQAWPRLHRLNRHKLGSDPHLIHPGTRLRLPAWATVPTRGASR